MLSMLADVVLLALAAGAVGLPIWAGVSGSDRLVGLAAAVGAVGAVALGAWYGTRHTTRPASMVAGGLAAFLVVAALVGTSWVFAAPILDFHSVAVALDWVEAPNLGTAASEALNRYRTALPQNPSSDSPGLLSGADRDAVIAIVFLVALLLLFVIAGVLGGAVNRRRAEARASRRDLWERPLVGLAAVVVGTAVLAVIAWPSTWAIGNAAVDFDQSSGPEIGVNLSEVAKHPGTMWGERVTVSANVQQVVGPHVALIGSETRLVGNTLMIVSDAPLQERIVHSSSGGGLSQGDVVQVSGTVRRFDVAAIESDLGMQIDGEAIDDYGGPSVLVVDAIDLDVPAAAEAGDPEFSTGGTGGYDSGVTVDDIVHNPEANLGLTVTVSGEIEETVLTPHVFVLDDQGLLAISPEPRPGLFVEATAYVRGEVRMFDIAEVERETGLDLDDETLRAFQGKPFVFVESVTLAT